MQKFVLLVEDEPIVQKVHLAFLERLGCTVELATNGLEALNKATHKHIIFMDLGLPDISGYEVTSEIRRRENGNHNTPIIVLTGYILSEVTEKCLEAGANAIFNKPINIDTLKNILDEFANVNSETC
jgi:CheY-like chemotaxis protein